MKIMIFIALLCIAPTTLYLLSEYEVIKLSEPQGELKILNSKKSLSLQCFPPTKEFYK